MELDNIDNVATRTVDSATREVFTRTQNTPTEMRENAATFCLDESDAATSFFTTFAPSTPKPCIDG